MSTEVATKKRGRPKKAADDSLGQSISSDASNGVSTTPKSTKSRSFSSTSDVSAEMAIKKPTKKKAVKSSDVDDETVKVEKSVSKPAKTTKTDSKAKSKTSPIIEEAKAFTQLKSKSSKPQSKKAPVSKSVPQTTNSVSKTASAEIPNSKPSFLSTFLDDKHQDSLPQGDTISDRSAFQSSAPPIDDIVSGAGVSDISSFPTPKPSTRPSRDPAIPIKAPKAFQSHKVDKFADSASQAEQAPPPPKSKTIDPATFATASFSSFKSSQPLASPAPSASSPPTPIQQAKPTTPPTPSSTTPTQPHPTAPTKLPTPQPRLQPSPPSPPKRPTQMTRTELEKDPRYKSLKRRWTGLILGVPLLITTSYMVWKRFGLDEELRDWRKAGEWNLGSGGLDGVGRDRDVGAVERVRGVLPVDSSGDKGR